MDDIKAKELLIRYREGKCTKEEIALVETFYLEYTDAEINTVLASEIENSLNRVGSKLPLGKSNPLQLWYRIAAAAAILAFLSFGLYFAFHKQSVITIARVKDIGPGKSGATLILSNGQKMLLSNVSTGNVAGESGTTISKSKNGELVYTTTAVTGANKNKFNTLLTTRGETYQVILPDGSHVWLNAESSIKYPVAFSGNERKVEITGEAYFEVAHDKRKPFTVNSNGQSVQVLGTHFNINAYADDGFIRTTLLEGSVRVQNGGQKAMLKPGEQAKVGSSIQILKDADTEEVVAWKNGYFLFNENLKSIMDKISRWYDIQVVYPGNINMNQTFSGAISRSKNITSVLNIMESTGNIHFKIEGRRVIVIQ